MVSLVAKELIRDKEKARRRGVRRGSRLDIEVAVDESLVNAIVHGNRRDEARHVTLEIALDSGGLEIRGRDEGYRFDPASFPILSRSRAFAGRAVAGSC